VLTPIELYFDFAGRIWICTNTVYNIQTVKDFGTYDKSQQAIRVIFPSPTLGFYALQSSPSCQITYAKSKPDFGLRGDGGS